MLDLFEFEAVPGDGGGAEVPADPVEPSPVGEPPAPEAPAVPAAPQIDWNDPQVQQAVAGLSQQQTLALLEQLGLVSYDQPRPAGPQAPDPLSDNYAAELEAWYQAKQAESLAPFQAWAASQQQTQADGQIVQTIDKTLASQDIPKPEDPAQAQAFTSVIRAVAESFTGQAVQQFGATPRAAEEAVRMAVEYLAADRKASGEQAVAAYIASLTPGKSTPYEPGVTGAGRLAEGGPQSEAEVARMFRDRQPV